MINFLQIILDFDCDEGNANRVIGDDNNDVVTVYEHQDHDHDEDEVVDRDDDDDDGDDDGEHEAVDGVGIMGCCEVGTVRVHFQRGINVYIFYKEGFRSLFLQREIQICIFFKEGSKSTFSLERPNFFKSADLL